MKIPPTFPPREEWITLSKERVVELVEGSRLRDGHGGKCPEDRRTRKDGSKSGHKQDLLGDLAEEIYAQTTGLTMNEEVVVGGVKGDDFPDGINSKAATYIHKDCYLLINQGIKGKRVPSRGYASVLVARGGDEVRSYSFVAVAQGGDEVIGVILGWASVAEVKAAGLRDVGWGPKLAIHHTKLHRPGKWLERGAFPKEVLVTPESDPIMQDLLDMF